MSTINPIIPNPFNASINTISGTAFNLVGSGNIGTIKYIDCGSVSSGLGCTGKKRGKYKKESFKIQVGNNTLESVGRTATLSSIATLLSNLKEGEQANILIQRT